MQFLLSAGFSWKLKTDLKLIPKKLLILPTPVWNVYNEIQREKTSKTVQKYFYQ